MANRAYEGSSEQCALWNRKTGYSGRIDRRVLVVHADPVAGDSLAFLLGLRGFSAQLATTVGVMHDVIEYWQPQAIFLDTRIGGPGNYDLARQLAQSNANASRLLIAMSNCAAFESAEPLKAAGYDGHIRRPCPIWQMADLLDDFYA
jgi:CheY-like chemotaxis protein